MKKLFLAAMIAGLLGSPALAQSYDPDLGTANITPVVSPFDQNGIGAYAHAAPTEVAPVHRKHASRPASSRMPAYSVSGGDGWYSQDGW